MSDNTNYKLIFEKAESALISVGDRDDREVDMRRSLERFKLAETATFSDADYFRIIVHVIFYSGFKAATVSAHMPVIDFHFGDFRAVSNYTPADIGAILADPEMIRNRGKIEACVHNAKEFATIVRDQGSFQNYVDGFGYRALDGALRLREDFKNRFSYLGKITAFHFLTQIGAPVLKPDLVIMWMFHRLGLIASEKTTEENLLAAVREGHRFAGAADLPIRYIDAVFVSYGQVKQLGVGVAQGICVKKPRCKICGITNYCEYYRSTPVHIDGTIGQSHRAFPPGSTGGAAQAEIITMIAVDEHGKPFGSDPDKTPS